ncbi:MAG TPA: hypothetical protein VN909_00765, partial [Candidatus Dormibacteraeota bacterium]|nr:hypothetical protein [Candidatus Dormibacteraeota bacterium]
QGTHKPLVVGSSPTRAKNEKARPPLKAAGFIPRWYLMSTIPCDFCPHPVDRGQMEEIEISHYVPDSSGEDLAYARTYFFGHPDCVRKFYRTLVDHKLDLFKHIPSAGSPPDAAR